ncbi:conserved hypothetical protein [Halomonas sp. 59]|nr:conserved hypothetical protein [Halomonas sp. 156]CAD5266234.1 conserved hypothetical protein [Halomonas sp. I3]CAD5283429.1 conserved hypothetical protein [Halomonas sp. 113]CAD5284862.1 conserved hypothetical protein [Halomonas sp. 59]VXB23864.1 conserved hypothetical protein [Halomonas titanicae]
MPSRGKTQSDMRLQPIYQPCYTLNGLLLAEKAELRYGIFGFMASFLVLLRTWMLHAKNSVFLCLG